jgi:hypothetical protein
MADYNPRLKKPLAGLTLAALGVVYGDIGTSPLYAVKETFNPDHGIPLNTSNVLGGLSTIFWSLMIVLFACNGRVLRSWVRCSAPSPLSGFLRSPRSAFVASQALPKCCGRSTRCKGRTTCMSSRCRRRTTVQTRRFRI